MCPECGGIATRVINASHDPEGNRIRRRECEGCGHKYPTVEVAFPYSFHEADADKREAPAYSGRIKVPEYEPSYFQVERATLRRRVIRHSTASKRGAESVTVFDPDPEGEVMLVRLKRSSKVPRCRKGIHVMRGQNVYHHPRGHKVCNACRREAANARYHNAWSKMPEVLKDEIRAKDRKRFSKYRTRRAA